VGISGAREETEESQREMKRVGVMVMEVRPNGAATLV